MINQNLLKVLQEQLNKEFYSAYLYLSMSAYFSDKGLLGFANWMRVQAQEEKVHAMLIYDYLVSRNEKVILTAIDTPPNHWESPLNVMEDSLSHEIYVTGLINNIMAIAEEVRDRATISYMYWFIDEQVEEEASAKTIVDTLRFIGEDRSALLLLDQELGKGRSLNLQLKPGA
jgi:Ferritin-like protein